MDAPLNYPNLRTYRLTPHAPDRSQTLSVRPRNRLIPDATYRRRPTANPSNAPPTTNTIITIRMNLPIPATKPRASSSAASRPTWVAAKVMAINGRASRRHDSRSLGVSVRTHIHNQPTNCVEDENWSDGDLWLPRRRRPCQSIAVCTDA